MKTIGQNIRRFREWLRHSPAELGMQCHLYSDEMLCFSSYLHEIGEISLNSTEIMRIAEALKCKWKSLFEGVDFNEAYTLRLFKECAYKDGWDMSSYRDGVYAGYHFRKSSEVMYIFVRETIGKFGGQSAEIRIDTEQQKQEQDKMSETKSKYRTINQNIQQAIENDSTVIPKIFYLNIYKMTGWKHVCQDRFTEDDSCNLQIDKGGREDEIAKIIAAASKILVVNPLNFFHNVEMNESRVKLANEIVRIQIMENYNQVKKEAEEKQNGPKVIIRTPLSVHEFQRQECMFGGSQWPQEVINKIKVDINAEIKKQKASELIEKAHRFTFNCKCNPEKILNSMQEIHSDWTHDTEYLKYVDYRELMIGANGLIRRGRYLLIKGLIKIKEFKDMLTANDNEIIKLAIETAREHHVSREYLKIFCVIATTEEVRRSLYYDFSCNYTGELFGGDGSLKTNSLRDISWLVNFFTHNNPRDDDNDRISVKYKNALIKDILGE